MIQFISTMVASLGLVYLLIISRKSLSLGEAMIVILSSYSIGVLLVIANISILVSK